ncbi:MAG TPA: maleylpyruvate isomerase family mycothiol-dependent enzyme [Amycolatopsis sp.]
MNLGNDRFAAELLAQTEGFAALVTGADPTRLVPTCPEWTLEDLVAHVGRGLRWAAAVTAQRTFVPFDLVPEAALPDAPVPWVRSAAALLVSAVAANGAGNPAWTWVEDQRAGFWLRRMTHELVVHRADAAAALDAPYDVEPALAADGVTEFFELIPARLRGNQSPALRNLAGNGETLQLHATDVTGDWRLTRTPDGLAVTDTTGPADVTVQAPASDLMLVLYGRRPVSEVEVLGDMALFEHVRSNSAF